VLPQTSEAQAILTANAIHGCIRDLRIANPACEFDWVTLSIGIAHRCDGRSDALEVLREADLALYQAKRCGRNRTVLASALSGEMVESRDAPATAMGEP
jgi:diguanylate cyclase (GGDEF)-like protein